MTPAAQRALEEIEANEARADQRRRAAEQGLKMAADLADSYEANRILKRELDASRERCEIEKAARQQAMQEVYRLRDELNRLKVELAVSQVVADQVPA